MNVFSKNKASVQKVESLEISEACTFSVSRRPGRVQEVESLQEFRK
jgi:hypothetical protein